MAKPCKEGEKPVERQTPSAPPSGAGRSGTAADLQERSDWRSPLTRGTGGDRKSWHGQSAAAPVLTAVPLGGRIEEARRSVCSSALPSRRGAGTWPGSPAGSGSSPAGAPSQPLHGPVRGRLHRQVDRWLSWKSGCRVEPPGCAVTEQRCAWHQRMRADQSLPQRHLLGCSSRAAYHVSCTHVLGAQRHVSFAT
jgi:hypothetical protein